MTDKIDIAQELQLKQVQIQPKDFSRPSLIECEECGNDIPVERQRYGSVTLCVECKNT
ncbi:TraR/DksA C4-type zinc finger protein [Acinetobacter baumannii]|uniref:TraR/DksA C4-type zinc finger protein n=1 Tax=Acinetobacter baumannii TaxID=470 RepID=UPI002940E9E7|nr:TraR/DksA C4-type zinc finger protein [Acinetobacter baumannii]MDV4225534.1 TraR/DksA C4-type zinc finger protein [Acinetobacter baumannii]